MWVEWQVLESLVFRGGEEYDGLLCGLVLGSGRVLICGKMMDCILLIFGQGLRIS